MLKNIKFCKNGQTSIALSDPQKLIFLKKILHILFLLEKEHFQRLEAKLFDKKILGPFLDHPTTHAITC